MSSSRLNLDAELRPQKTDEELAALLATFFPPYPQLTEAEYKELLRSWELSMDERVRLLRQIRDLERKLEPFSEATEAELQ